VVFRACRRLMCAASGPRSFLFYERRRQSSRVLPRNPTTLGCQMPKRMIVILKACVARRGEAALRLRLILRIRYRSRKAAPATCASRPSDGSKSSGLLGWMQGVASIVTSRPRTSAPLGGDLALGGGRTGAHTPSQTPIVGYAGSDPADLRRTGQGVSAVPSHVGLVEQQAWFARPRAAKEQ
jgi:hypothetical protein